MEDQILGGLYGQALGDAWAMPAMLTPNDTWEKYGGWITEFLPGPEDHPVHAGLMPGQVTDDTEQAFALAEAIIREGGVTVAGAAQAIVDWYERIGGDNVPYVGPSTTRAVRAIKRGDDLNETGRFGDTNGAAMRISPVGLIHPGDLPGAVEDARIACTPTHNTDVAISGAAAVAGAIAVALRPGVLLEDIIQAGKQAADIGRSYGHRWMGASVSRRITLAVEIARSQKTECERLLDIYEMIGTSLAIPESIPAAFGVFVMADGDPKQTAIYAAGLSGDADTVAAIACAIAGAWRGSDAFDEADVQTLKSANPELDFDRVASGLSQLALKHLDTV